jgi:hypothetical protein
LGQRAAPLCVEEDAVLRAGELERGEMVYDEMAEHGAWEEPSR